MVVKEQFRHRGGYYSALDGQFEPKLRKLAQRAGAPRPGTANALVWGRSAGTMVVWPSKWTGGATVRVEKNQGSKEMVVLVRWTLVHDVGIP
eukprot:SAG11_NODE_58_length_19205_cov_30.697315_7_plen_92_part_00